MTEPLSHSILAVGKKTTRIILDVSDIADARQCLTFALDALGSGQKADWGYWNSADPKFSAYFRSTKRGVSVHGRRKPVDQVHD